MTNGAAVQVKANPENPATSTPAPSASPAKTPSGSGSSSAEPTATASTTAPAGAPGGGTGSGAGTTLTTAAGGGSLAHTGASSTGLYSALAGVLVALGGAAAWIGSRRRAARVRPAANSDRGPDLSGPLSAVRGRPAVRTAGRCGSVRVSRVRAHQSEDCCRLGRHTTSALVCCTSWYGTRSRR